MSEVSVNPSPAALVTGTSTVFGPPAVTHGRDPRRLTDL